MIVERNTARKLALGMLVASTTILPFSCTQELSKPQVTEDKDQLLNNLPQMLVPNNLDLSPNNFAVLAKRYSPSPNLEVFAYVFVFSQDIGPVNFEVEFKGYQFSLPQNAIEKLRETIPGYGHEPDRETYLVVLENGVAVSSIFKIHNQWLETTPQDTIVLADGSHAIYPNGTCQQAEISIPKIGAKLYYESCPEQKSINPREFISTPEKAQKIVGENFDIYKNADEFVASLKLK